MTEHTELEQEGVNTADSERDITDKQEGATDQSSLQAQLAEQQEKYLRLYAEFDNFRRRTAKEKIDIIKTAGQEVIAELLPVLDDFERAERSVTETTDIESYIQGFLLIKEKLFRTMQTKGLQAMEVKGKDFDPDFHEAITEIPAPDENHKGKVIEEVEKGYMLHDKIIRYAKVVVGK